MLGFIRISGWKGSETTGDSKVESIVFNRRISSHDGVIFSGCTTWMAFVATGSDELDPVVDDLGHYSVLLNRNSVGFSFSIG